jgi:hypothetical protein
MWSFARNKEFICGKVCEWVHSPSISLWPKIQNYLTPLDHPGHNAECDAIEPVTHNINLQFLRNARGALQKSLP